MRSRRFLQLASLATLLILADGARGASISYLLDQSNADPLLPDNRPYVQVTVADGAAGAINFALSTLPALAGIAGEHFGLTGFAFSTRGAAENLRRENIVGLPPGWSIAFDRAVGGFGSFDVVLGRGAAATALDSNLTFSIVGVRRDSIADYTVLSDGCAVQGQVYYAARLAGFLDQDPGSRQLTAAWFGANRIPLQPVPVPGAGWLLLSAGGWLVAVRRQSRR